MGLRACASAGLLGLIGSAGAGAVPRQLAESPTLGSCSRPSDKLGGRTTAIKDDAVQTSVDVIGSNVDGFTTYRVKLHLNSAIESVYTIFGTEEHQLIFPPAYQCPDPFGVDVGGVNSAFFEVANSEATGFAQYDSWLTVGLTNGDGSNSMSSLGIDFRSWDEEHELYSDIGTGGAVFWMDPHLATTAVSADRTVVVAQLTIAAAPSSGQSATARFDARECLAFVPGPSTCDPPSACSAEFWFAKLNSCWRWCCYVSQREPIWRGPALGTGRRIASL